MYNEVDVNEVERKKRRTEAERRDREGDNYVRIIMKEGEREKDRTRGEIGAKRKTGKALMMEGG
jgi:hypothetical protein